CGCPTPIDEERLTLRLVASVHARPRRLPARRLVNAVLTQLVLFGFVFGARQDFPIWENKRYLDRPALALGDGPIGAYRRWARQFYEADASDGADDARAVTEEPLLAPSGDPA